MKISIIGNGNVAQNLSLLFKSSGHDILDICSRQQIALESFCSTIDARPVLQLSDLNPEADIIVVAVSDDAISEVLSKIALKHHTIVHTSGSVSMEVFEEHHFNNYGVLYPLYSFTKAKLLDVSSIPFLLESNNSLTYSLIESLTKSLSDNYRKTTSEERVRYHLTAVFVNNFTNYILGTAQEFAYTSAIDFDVLKPILMQTAENAINAKDIHSIQTGPAIRNNTNIIEKHLNMLSDNKKLQDLYRYLSQLILEKSR